MVPFQNQSLESYRRSGRLSALWLCQRVLDYSAYERGSFHILPAYDQARFSYYTSLHFHIDLGFRWLELCNVPMRLLAFESCSMRKWQPP